MYAKLAEYRSHKVVQAGRIDAVTRPDASGGVVVFIEDRDGTLIAVDLTPLMVARHMPLAGDYLVVYADGYRSISPAKAFEDGYTRVE